jgi:uncharacterized protein YndB with AHSA1/START domain
VTEVVTSIDIAAPPERVWALAMDPNCLSEWVTIHRRLHGHDDGPPRKGYEMEQTLHLRGVNFKVHWELVAFDEGHHAEWHGRGPARSHAETEYRLTPVDGGTRFDYRNEFRAPFGPLGAAASRALVGGVPQREANASLEKLKAIVEQG